MENNQSRRNFIKATAIIGAGALLTNTKLNALAPGDAPFATLPALPYDYAALEPHIDMLTMQIHHDKHHKTYVDKLNEAMAKETYTPPPSLESLFETISAKSVAIRNHGGGHYNHSMFWQIMTPKHTDTIPDKLKTAIDASFGNVETLKKQMNDAASKRFGSGWAWLVQQKDKLVVSSTPNQDNPLMDVAEVKGQPLIGIDVWEHAYYLKYQNKRGDYLDAWWNVVNWNEVAKRMR